MSRGARPEGASAASGEARHPALPFGDHIVYVDESGTPHLTGVAPQFPVLVLACCIFEKALFAAEVVPAMLRFKLAYCDNDQVVLHEREIRQRRGAFAFLNDRARERAFMDDLSRVVADAPFTVVAVILDKAKIRERYRQPPPLYEFALMLGLERVCMFLKERGQADRLTHLVFEHRGRREDQELELEFRRLTGGAN